MDQAGAFTWKELLALVVVIGLLVGVMAPAAAKARMKRERISCVSNLKNIGLSYRIFDLDRSRMPWEGGGGEGPITTNQLANFWVISNELSTPKILVCPADRQRREALNWKLTSSNVSYFANLRASADTPEMPMVGDDNLLVNGAGVTTGVLKVEKGARVEFDGRRHVRQGNLVMSDGSVHQLSNWRLQVVVDQAVSETNLLLDLP